ncbi:aspartate aminotransferase family protein [Lipingzhangella sp. LS1_29]|uniref:Aspartate aminotransferase family protein n=1 Tax=Lipingzhangella rawalii TaxID=2055835 RepID=A0ABU2H7J6_9ACTN|nr:aspartate aminotransferase family protein [Lipingzhangella rawalii]MDS1271282.1 aspartate aminotransferase family protein [Lipingzhangella rawalii]
MSVHEPSQWTDTAPRTHLLTGTTSGQYQQLVAAGAHRVARRIAGADGPTTGPTVRQLTTRLAGIDLDHPLRDSQLALDELEDIYLRDAVYFHHPRYLAHLNCPVALPALLGETVLSAVNSSLDTWDQSTGATLIEQRLVEWTAQQIGMGPSADGVFTSGGTQSNLQALLLARDETISRLNADDPRGATGPTSANLSRLCILTSESAHFSVAKSAALLGLGYDAVRTVACDATRRMVPAALRAEIEDCQRRGLVPMAVVATAGTTDFGSIDPLPDIAAECTRSGVWLHVDAAYGCGLLVSRHRYRLDGIEHADSVTVDFHKSFFQPVSSSAVIVRERRTLRHATYHAEYLNPADTATQTPNQVDKSIQTTRRFDALKLWLTLRIMGAEAIGTLFDTVIERATEAAEILTADPRFQLAAPPQLSTVVFRYVPGAGISAAQGDAAAVYARNALYTSGSALVAQTTVDGRRHLKLTILNPDTTRADITTVRDLLAGHAEEYLAANGVLAPAS